MQAIEPHYLLFSATSGRPSRRPRWRFVLQPVGSDAAPIAASDVEPSADPSRLELLAVVRGLEALAQPSRVTLLTVSRHVRRSIRHDLCQWREQNWRWERFGRLVPIRDQDLWERVDRALAIHRVECWPWQSIERSWTDRFRDQSRSGQIVAWAPPTRGSSRWGQGQSMLSRTA